MIRRLIGDGKLAARLKGSDDGASKSDVECPICFLNYTETNLTSCCAANICTECFLQVKPQQGGKTGCPFCKETNLRVSVAKPNPKNVGLESPLSYQTPERPARDTVETPEQADTVPRRVATDGSSTGSGFGSSLEQHVKSSRPNIVSDDSSSSLALTPDERKRLESQVKSQNFHPLAMRLQQEEEERRIRNQLEYYTSRPPSSRYTSRGPFISEEQQIAMAIEASLRDGS